jgi:transcriptional regulator with XRE-family HTH domain
MKVAQRIKELRIERRLTQVQLAKSVGCSQPMVVMWENGKCEPTASAIVKLAQALNCTTDYLLGVSDL